MNRPLEHAGCGDAAIAELVRDAAAAQWVLDDVDWTRPPRLPRIAPWRLCLDAVSQLHHGEALALDLCNRLADRLDDPLARAFLALQRRDEARHVAAYRRYLARLGDIAPPLAGFAQARASVLAADPLAAILFVSLVLEDEALALHHELAAPLGCPLLRAVMTRVERDEARHVAFGRRYAAARIAALSAERRHALAAWILELWQSIAAEAVGRLLPRWLPGRRALLAARRATRVAALAALGLPAGQGTAR